MKSLDIVKFTRLLGCGSIVALLALTSGRLSAATLTAADAVGSIVDGSPANYSAETTYTTTLLTQYNNHVVGATSIGGHTYTVNKGANVPAAPVSLASMDLGLTTVSTGSAVNVATNGAAWVIAKFGPNDELFYIGGMSTFTLPDSYQVDGIDKSLGLSGYSLHGSATPPGIPGVPDGGATVALLGLALGGLTVARRLIKR